MDGFFVRDKNQKTAHKIELYLQILQICLSTKLPALLSFKVSRLQLIIYIH